MLRHPSPPTGITVNGTGMVAIPVDQVLITLAAQHGADDPGVAFTAAAHTTSALLQVLANHRLDQRDIRTATITLNPRSEWADKSQERFLGYEATQELIVRSTVLDSLPDLLTDVVAVGAGIRLTGITLSAGDTAASKARARDAAFADALATAEQLAGRAGRTLGALVSVQEDDDPHIARAVGWAGRRGNSPPPRMPVATGDDSVSVTLTARWEFTA